MNTSPPETPENNSPDKSIKAHNMSFLTCDDAAACLHELVNLQRQTELHWFILKDALGHFHCAQATELEIKSPVESDEAEEGKESGLQSSLVVPVSATSQLSVPDGYVVEASFHSHPAKARGRGESPSEWSPRNRFFSMSDLASVMSSRKKYTKCYLSSVGGLLVYTSRRSAIERELIDVIARDRSGKAQMFENLYERSLLPSSLWILLAIMAGEVVTVVTGDLWRRKGLLKASWRTDIMRENALIELMPVCGPICRDVKEVALHLRSQQSQLSAGRQSMGFVLKHKRESLFITTAPSFGRYAEFDRAAIFPKDHHGNPMLPENFRVYGVYHSSRSTVTDGLSSTTTALEDCFFSPADLETGLKRVLIAPHQRLFLVTSDGAVLCFAKLKPTSITDLLAAFTEGLEQKIASGEISTQMFIDKVAATGTLSVLVASKTWPALGRVTPSTDVQIPVS